MAPTTAAFKITEGGNVIRTLEFEVEDIFPVEEQLKYNWSHLEQPPAMSSFPKKSISDFADDNSQSLCCAQQLALTLGCEWMVSLPERLLRLVSFTLLALGNWWSYLSTDFNSIVFMVCWDLLLLFRMINCISYLWVGLHPWSCIAVFQGESLETCAVLPMCSNSWTSNM